MQKISRLAIIFGFFLSTISLFAQGTRTWEQSKFDEFEKGTAKGVAIRSDGYLELAPSFKPLATTQSTYLWAIASDDRGDVFAAAGAPSRVYRITPDGSVSVILAPTELQVQALVVDKSGVIYAATSPDGKVYRIERKPPARAISNSTASQQTNTSPQTALDPGYTSSVYFDPKTKYIWALAIDNDGRLYVATGDHGEIFRVNRDGTSSVFFKSDDAHIRAIAFDPKGNLIAGSDGSGLIYRISPTGEGFVLYSAPKKEITTLAIDNAGNIYAAAAGDKKLAIPVSGPVMITAPQPTAAPTTNQPAPQPVPIPPMPVPGLGATGSEIYRIASDGSPKRLWSSRDDLVYALAFDQNGRLIAGTGNKGKIYGIGSDGQFSDMLKASANQVIGFAHAPKGALYAATSNLGKLFVIEDSAQREGTYESDVFDARIFSRWGRAEIRSSGNVELFARSGNVDNPDRNWSTWKKVNLDKDMPLDVPPARYMQWRTVLHSGNPSPRVDSVTINYLGKNVAPEVDDVNVQVGYRNPTIARTIGERTSAPTAAGVPTAVIPPLVRDRDSIAVSWRAHDDNDDQLSYAVYYRGDGETRWKLLKDNLADHFYSFEAGLLPDGGYTIRVVASDAPSHSPDDALTGSKESSRFEVDNTPPMIGNLAAVRDGENLHITFSSTDSFSAIRRAEISIDAGEWQYVAPVGELSDARTENYDVTVPLPRWVGSDSSASDSSARTTATKTRTSANPVTEEHVVVVRTFDSFDNMGSAKAVVRSK
jgi:sugar lactone lactonase YvrE